MQVALRALVAALAFGPLAVHGLFEHITFSPIDQCGAFNVSFGGGVCPDALPLRLTIVPFNASPIIITIPEDAWNATSATGAVISLLPLAANTTFLASLDDANGNPTGVNTSDIIQVQSSNNTSCLPTAPQEQPSLYDIDGMTMQCELFDVTFNSSTIASSPTARAFIPLAPSFRLDTKSFSPGEASYLMNVTRGTQLALLFDDGAGHNQTSDLLTVFGDTDSSSQCLNDGPIGKTAQPIGSATGNTTGGLSRVAIIVIAVSTVAIVGTLSLMSIIFVVRERQRRRTARLRATFFPRGDPEKINPYVSPVSPAPVAPTPAYLPDPRETRVLTGQPYGSFSPRSETFARLSNVPLTPKTPKSGVSETVYALPSAPPPPMLSHPTPRNLFGRRGSLASVNARTIASLDIEQMLEQAAVSPGPASAFTAGLPSSQGHVLPSPRPNMSPVQITSPLPSALRISPVSSKRDAQELDVPSSATPSGRFSDYSPIQEISPSSRYRVAPFLDPPPFSAGSRRSPPFSPSGSSRTR